MEPRPYFPIKKQMIEVEPVQGAHSVLVCFSVPLHLRQFLSSFTNMMKWPCGTSRSTAATDRGDFLFGAGSISATL
ncbi:hypothetical protein RRG08_057476 [Elysia crispata]|uniref:Uncharacterized protein n=1 Tax=Elysia crispata TaxID=231223 RepID=A0AAE0XX15_9GAST|nr:hypothetical protein RRG08_057476 [Elysia crispata]